MTILNDVNMQQYFSVFFLFTTRAVHDRSRRSPLTGSSTRRAQYMPVFILDRLIYHRTYGSRDTPTNNSNVH